MDRNCFAERKHSSLSAASALLLSVSAAVLSSVAFLPVGADAFSVCAPIGGHRRVGGSSSYSYAGNSIASLTESPRRDFAIAAAGEEGGADDADAQGDAALESDETFKTHPALTREEIEGILSDVPVYGVVDEDSGDAILLREPDTEESIAYFFFNPETANEAFAALKKKKSGGADWAITRFSLADIWFELLDDGGDVGDGRFVADGVEYRLVPDGVEIGAARSLLEQSAEAMGVEASPAFQSPYNEVPVFLDQGLRIESDGKERFPMYLGLQDLVQTCQMVMADETGESSEYTAMVVVADLRDLVNQMQEESEVEFRKVAMFPPTPQQVQQPPQDDGVVFDRKEFEDVASLGTTDWSD